MLRSILRQLYRPPRVFEETLDDWTSEPYYDLPALARRMGEKAAVLQRSYIDYPAVVHLETLAVCNAACDFCPYPRLERQGARMSDALIEKVIDDLSDMPSDLPFQLAPYKVSDPFLEPRLFDIVELATSRLPAMELSFITNGTGLTERKIDRLAKLPRVSYLNVSLNYDDPEEYERVMKLPFERTLARLDLLHRKKVQGDFRFLTRVSRVAVDRDSDRYFMQWVRGRYPAFQPAITPRNDWIGEVVTEGAVSEIPDQPCHRWFDLSITATGVVAMCCMDGEAKYPKGDVNHQHALEIYNQPRLRELRQRLVSRRATGAPCARCTYLSY